MSVPTIQKHLDSVSFPSVTSSRCKSCNTRPVVVIIDTVYLSGRSFGVMIARDAHAGRTIDRIYVQSETIEHFVSLVMRIKSKGIHIGALVVDGRPGMLKSFHGVPTQMCQFHQIQIVTRYVTLRPKLTAGKQLRHIALLIPSLKKEMFIRLLTQWRETWGPFIQEKTVNEQTRRWEYTHRRIRSAYYSLVRNASYLFVYQEKQNRHLKIPNTTNGLDGSFAHMKDSLRVHRGLAKRRKIRLIESLIWR